MKHLYAIIFFVFLSANAIGQTVIKGSVVDADLNWPLSGVNISVKDKLVGTITDLEGRFTLTTQLEPPFTILISSMGYAVQEVSITSKETSLDIKMEDTFLVGEEVVVSASRVEDKVLNSSVTMEKLGLLDLQQTSAPNFFDELYKLKGVDMVVQSLNFRFPNARGFNSETNPRMNQVVDGMNNAAPGLSFAAGNIFGLSQLDIESVEYLVGASSAIYGPGGLNGTLLMTSKNPFDYQGLSVSVQGGLMNVGADYRKGATPLGDVSFRYARAINDKIAFKATLGYMKATDWYAADYRDKNDLNDPSLSREANPAYDGVNVYGDEIVAEVNMQDIFPSVLAGIAEALGYEEGTQQYTGLENQLRPYFGDQLVTRTGWKEEALVNYDTENLRSGLSVHYRLNDNLEAVAQGGYGKGTSVYTAQNRFSLVDFHMMNAKLELKSPDFYLRGYGVWENSGDSYDAGGAALVLNESWKPSAEWYEDYFNAFTPLALVGTPLEIAHRRSRSRADNRDVNGDKVDPTAPAFPLPGTIEFDTLFNRITATPVDQGGAQVIDRSSLYAVEAMYNAGRHIKGIGLIVGGNYRVFNINSRGTVFIDEPGDPYQITEYGFFGQLDKKIFGESLELTLSARYDKNENFKGRVTPRFSFVYSLNSDQSHKFRGSLQTAFRFPTIADQIVDIQVGPYRVIGGLPEVQARYDFDTEPVYRLDGRNALVGVPVTGDGPYEIPAFVPESVTAFEVGYRGLYLAKKLYVDAYLFQNTYNGFLATQNLVQNPEAPVSDQRRFQTVISTDRPITAYGWAIGADYAAGKGYIVRGNISYNAIEETNDLKGFETRFNTPDYRFNLGIGNRNAIGNLGFNINWRWQNEFFWESTFGNGQIPAFSTVDAQVSYKVRSLKSMFKIGGSNVLNDYYTTSFGSANIGGLYYISWTFDEFLN